VRELILTSRVWGTGGSPNLGATQLESPGWPPRDQTQRHVGGVFKRFLVDGRCQPALEHTLLPKISRCRLRIGRAVLGGLRDGEISSTDLGQPGFQATW